MKAAAEGASARSGSLGARCFAVMVMTCAAPAGWAQVDAMDVAEPPGERPARLEVTGSQLPRWDSMDGPTGGPRLDLTLLPPSRSAVGLSLGMSNFVPPGQPTALQGQPISSPQPSLDLGVRWRHTLESNHRVDVTAWRRMTPPPDAALLAQSRQPTYGARVEFNLKPVRKTGLVADRGFIGVQLEGGGRITVKRKDGRPMVYYRTTF